MAHHVFHRGALTGTPLEQLLAAHDWISLNYNNDTAGPIEDATGDGDYTLTGTPTFEAGASTIIPEAGESIDIDGFQRWVADATGRATGTGYTIIFGWRVETTNATNRIFEALDTGNTASSRRIIWTQSGNLGAFDGAVRSGTRTVNAVGMEALWAFRVNGDGTADFFENGIHYETITFTGNTLPDGADRTYAWGDYTLANTNPAYGKHYIHGIANEVLTDTEIYEIWKLLRGNRSGKNSYYKDVIEANGLDTNCVAHYPLHEAAGAQVLDASGNSNYGAFVGSPTLLQDSRSDKAVASVALSGSGQYLDAHVLDYASTDFTVCLNVYLEGDTSDEIFITSSTSGRYIAALTLGSDILVRVFDGSTLRTMTITGANTVGWHDFAIRWDQSAQTVDAWWDGVKQTQLDASAVTLFTATETGFGGNLPGLIGTGKLRGRIELCSEFNAALSDGNVETLLAGLA